VTSTMSAASGRTHDRAFVAFVDDNYFPGFVVLLKSLTLTNPDVAADVVVLHDGLAPANISRAMALRPDLRFVRVGTQRYERYQKGSAANYLYTKAYYILDAFRLQGYRTIVTLDTDMVVLDRIDDLFSLGVPFAAVPQFFDSDGGRKLNSGLLVFDDSYTDGTFAARLDAIGESGAYELERHDQGVITAALDGEYHRLPRRYNWVKRATRRGGVPPQDTAILPCSASRAHAARKAASLMSYWCHNASSRAYPCSPPSQGLNLPVKCRIAVSSGGTPPRRVARLTQLYRRGRWR